MTADGSGAPSGFDALYGACADPWGTRTRWYERRKRALLMGVLTRPHYDRAYEAGCGTGHISVELSSRVDRLIASDASDAALAIARRALAGHANVAVERHRLPDAWPDGSFDLVVLSEILYFVDEAQRTRMADAARKSVGPTGEIVACDWRGPIEGYGHSGEDAHRRFGAALDLPRLCEYVDDDFMLTVWSRDVRSAAVREGLR